MADIYIGRAPKEDYEQLMDMLDDVFFFEDEEPKRDFRSLLPKLYKEKYDPCYNNFVIKYGDVIKGAVGLFSFDFMVCGSKIGVAGIGNVACTRDSRGNGHMTKCLEAALESAIQDGADISMLGGDRQRYGYFGYEPMGVNLRFHMTDRSLKLSGIDMDYKCDAVEVKEGDTARIEKIQNLLRSQPFYPVREDEKLVDILSSWCNKPYAVEENGEFRGFFTMGNDGGIGDFVPAEPEDWFKLILCAMRLGGRKEFNISAPEFNPKLAKLLSDACAGVHSAHVESMCVFNYKNVIEAFLKLKALSSRLADGKVTLLIHGKRCDEKLEISVKDNEVCVCESENEADLELEHREAQRLIASVYSERRGELKPEIAAWFPVPIYCYGADSV